MAKALARSRGAWGNALGGYKTQSRTKDGKFSRGAGLSVGAGLHKKARKRAGGFVPYSRHGVGHHTVGANGGLALTKNRRISAGFYIKTDTKSGQKKAKKIRQAEALGQAAVASQITEHTPWLSGRAREKLAEQGKSKNRSTSYAEALVRGAQGKAWRKLVGKERKVPGFASAHGRVGTDQNGLPTLVIQHNSSRDKKKGSRNKRDKSTIAYNKMVTKTRGHKVKGKVVKPRPQRRNAARG